MWRIAEHCLDCRLETEARAETDPGVGADVLKLPRPYDALVFEGCSNGGHIQVQWYLAQCSGCSIQYHFSWPLVTLA